MKVSVGRFATAAVTGVMAASMTVVPAQANSFYLNLQCSPPNQWGATCSATAVNGVAPYTWRVTVNGRQSTYQTTSPTTGPGVGCQPAGIGHGEIVVAVTDGHGRYADALEHVYCGM